MKDRTLRAYLGDCQNALRCSDGDEQPMAIKSADTALAAIKACGVTCG